MTECPICGQEADKHARINPGDSWTDLFGKPPKSFFHDHSMIHVATGDDGVQRAFVHERQRRQI
jgi:hypothetical protein